MHSNQKSFQFSEDKEFFYNLFLDCLDLFESIDNLFDFNPAIEKRKQFNAARHKLLIQLTESYGKICFLQYESKCDLSTGLTIDHIIPLSTNELNKNLRQLKADKQRKVASQSFGSNHLDNLILACSACNNHKKHRLLKADKLREVLILKRRKTCL